MGARLTAAGIASASLALGALGWLRDVRASGLPQRGGEHALAGLEAAVEVRFDDWGVPHVSAQSELDLARALGFLHANDRMLQMELGRRAGAGRLAEVLGPPLVDVDRRLRGLGLARVAERGLERASTTTHDWLEAYAQGVNAWLDGRGHDLPPGLRLLGLRPEPWRPVDSAVFALLMAYDLGAPGRLELRRARWLAAVGPERLAELLAVESLHVAPELLEALASLPDPAADDVPAAARGHSNNWALAPEHTATAGALLAGDPHLTVGLPTRFFAARLSAPGFEVFAATLPGTPAPVIGVGARRAWSLTNTGLDASDVFLERVSADGASVRRGDGWLPLERRVERIEVRFGEPVELEVLHSDRGPFFPGDPDAEGLARLPHSVAWTALEAGDPLPLFLGLVREADLEGALAGAGVYVAPAQNLVVAQADGRLGLQVIGRVPERRGGDGRLPVPAWTGEYGWEPSAGEVVGEGLLSVPPTRNPRVLDPPSGRLATANADVRPPGFALPFRADWAPPHRTERLAARLAERDDWTVADFAALQLDVTSTFALAFAAALADDELTGEAARARDRLLAWDGAVAASGTGALFVLALRELMARVFADEWEVGGAPAPEGRGPEFALLRLLAGDLDPVWFDDRRTAAVEDRRVVVQAALEDAFAAGRARFGTEDVETWRLDELQTLTLRHPLSALPGLAAYLDRGPHGLPGHSSTIAAIWAHWEGDRLEVTGTAALRFVADPAAPANSRHAQPGGQSGHPFDPHYDDQLEAWGDGTGLPVPWEPPTVTERRILRLR